MDRLSRGQLSDILLAFERQAYEANAKGTIFDFLKAHGIAFEEEDEFPYDRSRVRILIAGESLVEMREIIKVLKQTGIDPSRVDTVLEYDSLQKYKWGSLQYSNKYSDVIVGPMGHSALGKGNYSSIISRMESEDGWPNIIRATASGELKITKNSLREALQRTLFLQKVARQGCKTFPAIS